MSCSGDQTARIWQIGGGQPVVLEMDDRVSSISLSSNERYLACGYFNSLVWIWDVLHGGSLTRLRGHTDSIYGVSFMPDGNRVLSASLDKTIKLWDWTIDEGQCLRTFNGQKVNANLYDPMSRLALIRIFNRTLSSLLPALRVLHRGLQAGQKTERYTYGIILRVMHSSGLRAISIVVCNSTNIFIPTPQSTENWGW